VKAKDIRELTNEELQQQLKERNEALWAFRMQMSSGVVDNVRGARNARRDIARIRTILRQRELDEPKGKK
jgi:large subunit ribosomal protein L29